MIQVDEEINRIWEKLIRNWDVLKKKDFWKDVNASKYVCIFGTGDWYQYAYQNFEPFISGRLDFLCDNNPDLWGTVINGVKCISPDELSVFKDEVFVFVAVKNPAPIFKQLQDLGVLQMNIVSPWIGQTYENGRFDSENWMLDFKTNVRKTLDILEDELSIETILGILDSRYCTPPEYENYSSVMVAKGDDYFQYTPLAQHLRRDELLIDIGAYTGDTIDQFISTIHGHFNEIHAFELDNRNYSELEKRIQTFEKPIKQKIHLYNYGLGDVNAQVYYKPSKEATMVVGSNIGEGLLSGELHVYDESFYEIPVTLIKIDVEGMEIEVLEGARRSIQTFHPKMAISIYHRNDHIWRIPQLIHEMNPEYKLYVRHQACINVSTVLYCI